MDPHLVPAGQAKVVRWHNPGASKKKATIGKIVVAKEKLGEIREFAFHLCERSRAVENRCAGAVNLHFDRGVARQRFANHDAWAERATPAVNLGLRKVEWIFALDIARAHVIADGVSEDSATRIDGQGDLWLWHVPCRITANAHLSGGPSHSAGSALESR